MMLTWWFLSLSFHKDLSNEISGICAIVDCLRLWFKRSCDMRVLILLCVVFLGSVVYGEDNEWFADYNGDATVDYWDFLSFAQHYDRDNTDADLNRDGLVGFADFLLFAEAYGQPVWRETDNGLWITTPRGGANWVEGDLPPRWVDAQDSLSMYIGCPPEYDHEPSLIFLRHEGRNDGTPKEWYATVQFLVGSNAEGDQLHQDWLYLKERYDFENKFLWGKRVGPFFVFNRSMHRADLETAFGNRRPVIESIVNPDGTVTIVVVGEEVAHATPEWVPDFIDMLLDPVAQGLNMPFANAAKPEHLSHYPDTIFDSMSNTGWNITDGMKQAIGRVQRKCRRHDGTDVF